MPTSGEPREPWLSFFNDFDSLLDDPVELHCLGGFVITEVYGVGRVTRDVDFIRLIPNNLRAKITDLGVRGSGLHKKHNLYFDPVTIANPPEEYESRLIRIYPSVWTHLTLYAVEAHDLALAKLERAYEVDRQDAEQLALAGYLDKDTFIHRYQTELRPSLTRETWHDQTLQLWVDLFWPTSASDQTSQAAT